MSSLHQQVSGFCCPELTPALRDSFIFTSPCFFLSCGSSLFPESEVWRVSIAHTRAGHHNHPVSGQSPPPQGAAAVRRGIKPARSPLLSLVHRLRGGSGEQEVRSLQAELFALFFFLNKNKSLLTFSTSPENPYFPSKWLVARWQGYFLRCASAAQCTACQRRAKDKPASIRCILSSVTRRLWLKVGSTTHVFFF